MKKILAIVVAVVLVASLSIGAVVLTSAITPSREVVISSATAKAGESKDITVSINNNSSGINSAKVVVTYPSDLTLTKITYSTALRTYDADEEATYSTSNPKDKSSPVTLNWVSQSQNVTGDVLYATLSFTVDGEATLGDKDITATADLAYYSSGTYEDQDLVAEKVSSSVTAGKITVVDCLHENTTVVPAAASTCKVAGHAQYTICNDCGSVIDGDATPLALAEHTQGTAVKENEVAADCTTGGSYDEVVYCTVCGDQLSKDAKTTNPLGHSWGAWTVTTPPTCVDMGKETRVCSRNPLHTDSRNIDPTGIHTPGTPVKENIVGADCTTGGTYDEVVYCTVCNVEISRTPKTTEALGHTEADEWSYDSGAHWKECTVCHMVIGGDSQAHTFEFVTTKEATATEDGLKEEMCTVCGYKTGKTEVITNYTDSDATAPAYDAESASQGAVAISTKMAKAKFSGVVINGVTLSSDDYELTEDGDGNAKVTISASYLAKLANGSYTVKIVGTDGVSTSTLTVTNSKVGAAATTDTNTNGATTTTTTSNTVKSPKDSDNDIAFLLIALLAVMGSSVFAGVTYRRKRNSK